MSLDIANGPLWSKILLVENHYSGLWPWGQIILSEGTCAAVVSDCCLVAVRVATFQPAARVALLGRKLCGGVWAGVYGTWGCRTGSLPSLAQKNRISWHRVPVASESPRLLCDQKWPGLLYCSWASRPRGCPECTEPSTCF